jgi:hypothetical protein
VGEDVAAACEAAVRAETAAREANVAAAGGDAGGGGDSSEGGAGVGAGAGAGVAGVPLALLAEVAALETHMLGRVAKLEAGRAAELLARQAVCLKAADAAVARVWRLGAEPHRYARARARLARSLATTRG